MSDAPIGRVKGSVAYRSWTLRRRLQDNLFQTVSSLLALLVVVVIVWIGVRLCVDSGVTLRRFGGSFITTSVWDVPHEVYGALPFLFGTIVSSVLALCISVPLSVGAALFLTEIAPRWLSNLLSFVIELLAAIPSIIFGVWGFLVLCPLLQTHVSPWLAEHLGSNPLFAGPPVMTNMLAAGVILAIMVLPIITAISREVIKTVSGGQREASAGLGATKWETIKLIVLPEARNGIAGAVILGFGRAIGETMAVVMVIGNTPKIAASLLQSGYTMPALLANQFNEAYNDKLQRSALLEVALILFVVTLILNALARLLIQATTRKLAGRFSPSEEVGGWSASAVVSAVGQYATSAFVIGFVGLQTVVDLRAHGLNGLLEPIEVVAMGFAVCRLAFAYLGPGIVGNRLRALTNVAMLGLLSASAFVACFVLGALLLYVAVQGIHGLSINLFTQLPRPPGVEGGGLKNAILGTMEIVGIAGAIGIPVGLMGGIYVSEFGGRLAGSVRFAADVLNGIPSVVIGLFAYAAFVLPFGHFSGWSGAGALAIMMIPTIMRTTEDMLNRVPHSVREAAMGLGASRVQTVRTVILPAAKSGIVTGIMLATARIAGETAPLLFTAFGSDQLVGNPSQPMSTLTMRIYQYAISPYDDWVSQAWAGALVLVLLILTLSIIARLATHKSFVAR